MSKIGNKNIGSIYVSHVCTSHDLSMLYKYEMDYINKMVHIHIGRMFFVDPSLTYMYKMHNIDIGYKFFVDPSMTYTYNVQDGSYRYST